MAIPVYMRDDDLYRLLSRQLVELFVILRHILGTSPHWPQPDYHPDLGQEPAQTVADLGEDGGGGEGDPPPPAQERPDAELNNVEENVQAPATAAVAAANGEAPASGTVNTPSAPPRNNRRRTNRRSSQSQPTEQTPATPATVQQRVNANPQIVQMPNNNNNQDQTRRRNNRRQKRRRRYSGSTDKPERIVPAPVNVGDDSPSPVVSEPASPVSTVAPVSLPSGRSQSLPVDPPSPSISEPASPVSTLAPVTLPSGRSQSLPVDPPSQVVSAPASPVSTAAPVSLSSGRPQSLPAMPGRAGTINWERLQGLRRMAFRFQLSFQVDGASRVAPRVAQAPAAAINPLENSPAGRGSPLGGRGGMGTAPSAARSTPAPVRRSASSAPSMGRSPANPRP